MPETKQATNRKYNKSHTRRSATIERIRAFWAVVWPRIIPTSPGIPLRRRSCEGRFPAVLVARHFRGLTVAFAWYTESEISRGGFVVFVATKSSRLLRVKLYPVIVMRL